MIRKIDEEISKKIKRHLRRVKWSQYICLSVNLHHESNFTIVNAALKYENMCIVSKKYVLKRDRHVIFPIYISLNENTHIFFFCSQLRTTFIIECLCCCCCDGKQRHFLPIVARKNENGRKQLSHHEQRFRSLRYTLKLNCNKRQETAANGAKQWQHDVTNVHERRVV